MPHFYTREAHQGVMADRRHSLKRGDRLSKKERQTTASDWKKSDKLRFMLWVKSDSNIYYNKRPGLHPWWASLDGRPINFSFPFTKLRYKLLINLSQIYNCAVKNSNSLNIVTATDLKV
jgi:hypothetical protein